MRSLDIGVHDLQLLSTLLLIKCNYRPVSILTTISKLYESILNDQMCDYFKDLFDALLSTYRKGYSCQSVLIKIIEDWNEALDNGKIVVALLWTFPRRLIVCHMVC